MELLENPFHILRATFRDSRKRIHERAEERSLVDDPDRCDEARAALTHPRKRLAAELGWFPGLSPKRTAAAVQVLKSDITKITIFDTLPPLARANLYAAALPRVSEQLDATTLIDWILGLARAYEETDVAAVLRLINEERAVAGFPEISDEAVIDDQISELCKQYESAVMEALDQRDSSELVDIVTEVVNRTTEFGTKHPPSLIDDIVDRYEIETHRFLESECQNVHKVVRSISEGADGGSKDAVMSSALAQLEHVMKNWDRVAQPIQVSRMSRGQEHTMSRDLAHAVRDVAVDIFNRHGLLEVSQRMTALQQEVFAEVLSAAEQADRDLAQLAKLEEDAKAAESQDEEWRRDMHYECEWGVIVKHRLRISADGIEWKNRSRRLAKITKIRWGATQHYTNSIPTGTDYVIVYGDAMSNEVVRPKSEVVFREFTSRLFRGVGGRLLVEMLAGLAKGQKYSFGNAVIDDFGVELETKKLFSANVRNHYKWGDLVIWSAAGFFGIGKRGDKQTTVQLSYQDDDNTHVLEAAIRMLWKKGGRQLSSVM